jgi:HEAT repeat protein
MNGRSTSARRLALAFLLLAAPARPDALVEAALQALRADPSLKVRAQAAIVLGQQGAPQAVPALRQAVAQDASAAVRLAAVAALARLGARAARPTLRAAGEADPDDAVRVAAARALEGLGPLTLGLEEPTGTPAARQAARDALARQLRERGFTLAEPGELRLRLAVNLATAQEGASTVLSVQASLAVIDGDGRLELLESTARATLAGRPTAARLASLSPKVIDAAVRGLCEDLAARLGRR